MSSPDPVSVWRLPPGNDAFAALTLVDVNERDLLPPFDGTPVGDGWRPLAALWDAEDGLPIPDIGSLHAPALTERARDALGDLLRDRAELLPLSVEDGPDASLVNVTHVSDALDEERSEIKRFSNGRFMRALRYAFDPDALAGHTFFKLAQRPAAGVYVTGAVVARIHEAGLTGADMRQVWAP